MPSVVSEKYPMVGSPVSDDGRGLKHPFRECPLSIQHGSPVSDDGRGLKHPRTQQRSCGAGDRPSAMTGAD